MAQPLAQLVALESAARADANKRTAVLLKNAQKPALFNGFKNEYEPFGETEEERAAGANQQPPQVNRVQLKAEDMLTAFFTELKDAIDLAAAKDDANTFARADVRVGGTVLLESVPATHLLHMEKVLADIGTFIAALPVTNPTEEWLPGEDGLLQTRTVFTNSNKIKKIVLPMHPGTKEHAPQVAVIDEQVAVGRWLKTDYTGALRPERKRDLERRVTVLKAAFKVAREEANRLAVAETPDEASVLIGYILG